MDHYIETESKFCASNYAPLPVVLAKGKGCYLWDVEGNRYLDFMSAYSAVSFGHSNRRLLKALKKQAAKLSLTSRAFYHDKLALFSAKLCALSGMDMMLPMNTGAEAVETAIKAARRWGYNHKNIPENKAEIIVAKNNFHGRTTTITSFSTEPSYKKGFGPFTPGFKTIPFMDTHELEKAITKNTCAFLVEPMQGEAGIIVPDRGCLEKAKAICKKHRVLLILDEVQTGFGRTGKDFAFQHEISRPDGLILGKALGGGLLPVSAFLANKQVMNCFTPGSHGSTFGGNPLACAIGIEAINILQSENLSTHSAIMGKYLLEKLQKIKHPAIKKIRGKGLWIGVEIDPKHYDAREICVRMIDGGVLTKETHDTVIRLAPPLIITKQQIDHALKVFQGVLEHV